MKDDRFWWFTLEKPPKFPDAVAQLCQRPAGLTTPTCSSRQFRAAALQPRSRPQLTAESVVGGFAAIKPHEIGEEADLCRRPLAVRAVDLPIDVTSVDEEHGVGTGRLGLAPVEEPQRAG